jgi:hypothetical protein
MTLFDVKGRIVKKNVSGYLIKWDKESKSKLQREVKSFLKPFWKSHIVYEEFPVYGTLLRVDFLNATMKIAVEVDGPQHGQLHFFHNKNPLNYLTSIQRDDRKYDWIEKNGFTLVIIKHTEVPTLSKEFFKEKFNIEL